MQYLFIWDRPQLKGIITHAKDMLYITITHNTTPT